MRVAKRRFDSIATVFALTILLTLAGTAALNGLFVAFAGRWALPPVEETAFPQRGGDVIRIFNAMPADIRPTIAAAAGTSEIGIDWYAAGSAMSRSFEGANELAFMRADIRMALGGADLELRDFNSSSELSRLSGFRYDRVRHPNAFFLAVRLHDSSWIILTAFERLWGLHRPAEIGLHLAFFAVSSVIVTILATRRLARPIQHFTAATRRFGADPKAPPMLASGPREMRDAAHSFNAMQTRIQKFMADRTMMLAAISHDLRTPLTRMRLRGELIDDPEQQARLFRDVDEMHAMIDAALAFFRDDVRIEEVTSFDVAELARTIVDDFGDQGIEVVYVGPEHLRHAGRPFALKRALTNLVDNATRYASATEIDLGNIAQGIAISVRDRGPGIPAESINDMFLPFHRLEKSRDRATGGVGLGLAAAQAIARDHGGDIVLRNRALGGLEAVLNLPAA